MPIEDHEEQIQIFKLKIEKGRGERRSPMAVLER